MREPNHHTGQTTTNERQSYLSQLRNDPYMMSLLHDPCVYCGGRAEFFDHITPTSKGGTTTPDNLAPICRPCNGGKGTKSVLSYLAYRAWIKDSLAAIEHVRVTARLWHEVGQ